MRDSANCPVEIPYQTPDGYYDQPYMIVDNRSFVVVDGAEIFPDPWAGLTINSMNQSVEGDSSFVLRRIISNRYAGLQLRDRIQRPMFSQTLGANQVFSIPVIPESIYPPGSAIRWDYVNFVAYDALSTAGTGVAVVNHQTVFQGVRRFTGLGNYPQESRYKWKTVPFTYAYTGVLGWNIFSSLVPPVIAPAQQFNVPVNDYDFVLESIRITYSRLATPTVFVPLNFFAFGMVVYDAQDRKLSNDWAYANYFNDDPGNQWRAMFPVPGLMYPADSNIKVDINSLGMFAAAPIRLYISMIGHRRIPC